MREYIHYTGAIIKIDDNGKKTIVNMTKDSECSKSLMTLNAATRKSLLSGINYIIAKQLKLKELNLIALT